MEYKYYNQFNLSDELAQSISSIISQKENADYVCSTILVTIPEHRGLVFSSPLDGYGPWGGGLNALSGAQIQVINEKYGKYVEGTIPAKEYAFLVVMKNEAYQSFSELSFESEAEIEGALKALSVIHKEYDGVFDSSIFTQKFPYLQEFFGYLDEWRSEKGRVTVDNDILNNGIKKTLSIGRRTIKK